MSDLGVHPLRHGPVVHDDGTVTFRVWAPDADRVDVVLDGRHEALSPGEHGWFARRLPAPRDGRYAFSLDGGDPRPDPASQRQPDGVHASSAIVDRAFAWSDAEDGWQPTPLASAVIYELHVGAFTEAGTFDAAVEHLADLAKLGVTHVEVMPVAAFNGSRGWGYDGVAWYAVHEPYGGPEAFAAFVDACHRHGLAVILDVVYNHFGPSGSYHAEFGPYLTDRHVTPWGPAINLDDEGADTVRAFIVDNASMWLADFHVDGLRLDAVHALVDGSAVHILERLSATVECRWRARPDDPGLVEAREALWRGQANDAYWHGVFGGCYLPHLRRAVKSALLDAEARLAAGGEPLTVTRGDLNGDGREEIAVRTSALAVTLNPARGGSLTEIGMLDRRHDLADVLTRRPESYHARIGVASEADGLRSIHDAPGEKQPDLQRLLVYDRFRRASLLDGWFEAEGMLDAVEPWPAGRVALGDAVFAPAVERADGAVEVVMRHRVEAPGPLDVDKRLRLSGATVAARYRLAGAPGTRLDGRWAVQWNLALSAGEAPGRYLTLPGRPSLASRGRVGGIAEVTLVDEWLGLEAHLVWNPDAELAWGPVETVSVSEAGFERIYQGLALLVVWPLGGDRRELSIELRVGVR